MLAVVPIVICPLNPAGHVNVREPVESWQIMNVAAWPAAAPETVELVTLPVSVISNIVSPDP